MAVPVVGSALTVVVHPGWGIKISRRPRNIKQRNNPPPNQKQNKQNITKHRQTLCMDSNTYNPRLSYFIKSVVLYIL